MVPGLRRLGLCGKVGEVGVDNSWRRDVTGLT